MERLEPTPTSATGTSGSDVSLLSSAVLTWATFPSSEGLDQLPRQLWVTWPAGCQPALLPSAALRL